MREKLERKAGWEGPKKEEERWNGKGQGGVRKEEDKQKEKEESGEGSEFEH